jgi:hypothetical protein
MTQLNEPPTELLTVTVWYPEYNSNYKQTHFTSTSDPLEIEEAVSQHPDHFFASNTTEAIQTLNERDGIDPPFTGWRGSYTGKLTPIGKKINSKCEPKIIAEFLKQNLFQSFETTSGFQDEWREYGITKDRQGDIRYDPKAAKAASRKRKTNPDTKERWRKKTGNYTVYLLHELRWKISNFLSDKLGVRIKFKGSSQSRIDLENGLILLIKQINLSSSIRSLFKEPGSTNHTYRQFFDNYLDYVETPTYREFQEPGSNAYIILDFIRSEAIRFGFITESNDSESSTNE